MHTDAQFKPLNLGGLRIEFKKTAPSALYWAGRPAMRVVQALHWLQDMLLGDSARVKKRLQSLFADPDHGPAIVADLREGQSTLLTHGGDAVGMRQVQLQLHLAEPPLALAGLCFRRYRALHLDPARRRRGGHGPEGQAHEPKATQGGQCSGASLLRTGRGGGGGGRARQRVRGGAEECANYFTTAGYEPE